MRMRVTGGHWVFVEGRTGVPGRGSSNWCWLSFIAISRGPVEALGGHGAHIFMQVAQCAEVALAHERIGKLADDSPVLSDLGLSQLRLRPGDRRDAARLSPAAQITGRRRAPQASGSTRHAERHRSVEALSAAHRARPTAFARPDERTAWMLARAHRGDSSLTCCLMAAVLKSAFDDSRSASPTTRDRARAWLLGGGRRLELWTSLAGVSVDQVRRAVTRVRAEAVCLTDARRTKEEAA